MTLESRDLGYVIGKQRKAEENKKLPIQLPLLKLPFKYFMTVTAINIANLGIKIKI